MSQVGVGWFDPFMFADDVDRVIEKIVKRMASRTAQLSGRGHDPLGPIWTREVKRDGEKTGVTYMAIARPFPISIDVLDGSSGSFHFVLHAQGRPALMTSALGSRSDTVLRGEAKLGTPFGMGCFELTPGLAVHYQPASTWACMAPMPEGDSRSILNGASALVIKVDNHPADEIGAAVEQAVETVRADRAYWDRPDNFIEVST